jgi:NAD(P)H-dependent FMN reductase
MYSSDLEADPPAVVRTLIDTCYAADGMLWSSPMYNGSVSGSFKDAIDWLHMLGTGEPPYLYDEVIGLISSPVEGRAPAHYGWMGRASCPPDYCW